MTVPPKNTGTMMAITFYIIYAQRVGKFWRKSTFNFYRKIISHNVKNIKGGIGMAEMTYIQARISETIKTEATAILELKRGKV